MDRTGNKRMVRQLLRACREEFRVVECEGFDNLFRLYEMLLNICRPARIIDDEGLRILGEHQDEWGRLTKGNEQLRRAVDGWFDALRDGLGGSSGLDVISAFSKLRDAIAAEKPENSQPRLKGLNTADPAYSMSDKDYETILTVIKNTAMTWECSPNPYRHMEEEDLRDVLLGSLNGCFPGKASGETFRKNGKTDIYIEAENRKAFVAECKIWTGKKNVKEALEQLDSYLTWRDCKTALIFFVKRKNFLSIVDKMPVVLNEQKNLQKVRAMDRNEFVCQMLSTHTSGHMIDVRVLLFNLYCDKDKTRASKRGAMKRKSKGR